MNKIVVEGGNLLEGKVRINGAKNSAVALLPAAIMADEPVTIEGLPHISDVDILISILEDIGCQVGQDGRKVTIDPKGVTDVQLPNDKVKKLRASYYFMGAMLGKFKEATIGMPGGCYLGPRPIDQHIKGFEALGATVTNEQGFMKLTAEKLVGARIYLDVVSVGATINIMLAAVFAEGKTTIENAAKEPEIIDVATLLTNMGAKIKGVGTDVIRIEGVEQLNGCMHTIIPDRIEAGTYAILAALQGKDILIDNVIPEHLDPLLSKLKEVGAQLDVGEEQIRIKRATNLQGVNIKTQVYPGFPTDLQQPFTTLLTQAEGHSVITDTIYSGRVKHVDELRRMNGNVKVDRGSIYVEGPSQLQGATVKASDLRAGAALIIAGLIANGTTHIGGIEHIERGYEMFVNKLENIGANIRKEQIAKDDILLF